MTKFKEMSKLYSKLEKITSHLKIVEELSKFFKKLSKEEVKSVAYLALGITGPKYEDIDMGLAEKYGVRAVSLAYDVSEDKVKSRLGKIGDLGDVCYGYNDKKGNDILIKGVYERLVKIRDTSGEGSQKKKIDLLSRLLRDASKLESKYIMRIALGKLRLGFGEKFLMEAFARAFLDKKESRDIVHAYNVCSDIGQLAESLAKNKEKALSRFSIKLFRPVEAMLAKRVDTIKELNEKFPGEMAVEEKYDGERIQVHIDKDKARGFSRRLDDISSQFPRLLEDVKKSVKVDKIILDGEIIPFEKGKMGSFQKLMQRRRKYSVKEYAEKLPVRLYLFDILYINGKSLLKKPYQKRRNILEKNVRQRKKVKLANRIVTSDFKDMQDFFKKSIDKGLEGVIVKSTGDDSIYQPGNRGWLWVKWKKEYAEGMRDTFDLVIVGSFHGRGRRKGRFGALLCALYNEGEFETFTKVGTGFTDKNFDEINKILNKHKISKKPANVNIDKDMEPDEYIGPKIVVEVLGAEITTSPKHTAGREKGEKNGLALRFPRFLHLRPDKSADEATTVKEARDMR